MKAALPEAVTVFLSPPSWEELERRLRGRGTESAEKIERIYNEVGGFGQLLVFGFDYVESPQAWKTSLGMLQTEVLPKVKHLVPPRQAGLAAAQ